MYFNFLLMACSVAFVLSWQAVVGRRELAAVVACGVLAGGIMFGVGAVLDTLLPVLGPEVVGEYADDRLFRSPNAPTMRYMYGHPFFFGMLFSFFYARARGVFRPLTSWSNCLLDGMGYGFMVFIAGSMPVVVLVYTSFRVSIVVVCITWFAWILTQCLAAGAVVGLAYKPTTLSLRCGE